MTQKTLKSDHVVGAQGIDFRALLPLPALRGLPLALTAVRACELWSDLATGVAQPAALKPSERTDIVDECMDIVVPLADHPAGFRFAGLSAAQLRAALQRAPGYEREREQFDRALRGARTQALREAARQRIQRRGYLTCFRQHSFWLPPQARPATVHRPSAVEDLCAAANPTGQRLRRNPLAVEVLETSMLTVRRFPVRGTRLPHGRQKWYEPHYIVWSQYRLHPQEDKLRATEYHEYQLALPSLETSYFSDHFPVRNLFAHLRFSFYMDRTDRKILLLEEVQSDWMRDLRRQRTGTALNPRRVVQGGRPIVPELIPDLPVKQYWLDLAMKVLCDVARNHGVDVIAWVPGRIQTELNVGLPLSVTQHRYDRQVPALIARNLVWATTRSTCIDYPTYQRTLFIECHGRNAWCLVQPDRKTAASASAPDLDTILQLYRIQAPEAVEPLPAFELIPAPGFIKVLSTRVD